MATMAQKADRLLANDKHFWFGVLETVDLGSSFLFGFTTGDKLKALTLQLFCTCVADGLQPSECACMSVTFTVLHPVNVAY